MNDFYIDQLVFSYYTTVMFFIGNNDFDTAVKIADQFMEISDKL